MKRFLDGVLKVNSWMQAIAAISLTLIILLTTVGCPGQDLRKAHTGRRRNHRYLRRSCRRLYGPYHLLDERPYPGRFCAEWLPRWARNVRRDRHAMHGDRFVPPDQLELHEDRDGLLDKGRGFGNTPRAPVSRLLRPCRLLSCAFNCALLRYPEDFRRKL